MVYLAGTYDSFGKDSELATMLVQGKPVIVYVSNPPPPPNHNLDSEEYKEWTDLCIKLESRYNVFWKNHPLRIQCDISTGVGNGVMVCRDIETCAKLLYRIFTNTMEFSIDDSDPDNCLLREKITDSAVRVVTRNQFLTRSFWNQWHSLDSE